MDVIESKLEQLFVNWKSQRDYEPFVDDGILNYQKWLVSNPKIMSIIFNNFDNDDKKKDDSPSFFDLLSTGFEKGIDEQKKKREDERKEEERKKNEKSKKIGDDF